MRCRYHGRIKDGQPCVRVDRSSVKDGGKCFLVFDEEFEVAYRHLKIVKELRALLEGECLVARR
jgi:hypothetical protein